MGPRDGDGSKRVAKMISLLGRGKDTLVVSCFPMVSLVNMEASGSVSGCLKN
jgi:hypothetical protein